MPSTHTKCFKCDNMALIASFPSIPGLYLLFAFTITVNTYKSQWGKPRNEVSNCKLQEWYFCAALYMSDIFRNNLMSRPQLLLRFSYYSVHAWALSNACRHHGTTASVSRI